MSKSLLLSVVFFLGISGALQAEASQPSATPRLAAKLASGKEPTRIVCFGDSITGVYYHTGCRRAWCDMLGIALTRLYPKAKLEMINAGISGNDTNQALKRIGRDVLGRKPDLVAIMFGMNDVARVPAEMFRQNLSDIVSQCRAAGSEVILMTPNSIYPEDTQRPVERLAQYAQIVRDASREAEVPLADCYLTYESIRAVSRSAWMQLMSETIHPNMRGHKVFAEEVAWVASGKRVPLTDVGPAKPHIPHTLSLLNSKQPIRVLAMTPYDAAIRQAFLKMKPRPAVTVTSWDVIDKSIAEIYQQAREWKLWNRSKEPQAEKYDLVVVGVPASAVAPSDETFYRSYSQILNYTISYGKLEWDCIALAPSVGQPDLDQAGRIAEKVALEVIQGQDIGWLRRAEGDNRSVEDILADWLRSQTGD